MKLFGVDFGKKMIGNSDTKVAFKVGPQRLAVVDDITKTMKVYFDGNWSRPRRSRWETKSGSHQPVSPSSWSRNATPSSTPEASG